MEQNISDELQEPLKQDVGKFGSLHCPMQLNTLGT